MSDAGQVCGEAGWLTAEEVCVGVAADIRGGLVRSSRGKQHDAPGILAGPRSVAGSSPIRHHRTESTPYA